MPTTEELLNSIKEKRSIKSYLDENEKEFIEVDLPGYLEKILKEKNIKKADVIADSQIDRTYCYQIFRGIKKPSRNKLIQLCIGMGLSVEEVQTLLKSTGFSQLYSKVKFDSVIIFALHNKLSVIETNLLLDENELEILN